jgi:hypothetical protein
MPIKPARNSGRPNDDTAQDLLCGCRVCGSHRMAHLASVMMMQVLPFYDDGALRTLRDFEELAYQNLR